MKYLSRVAIGIWLLTLGYFAYAGVTTIPTEGDSLAYHLPIAGIVAEGKWADRKVFTRSIFYYPAMGETLIAVMARLGLPLNLFNWIGWILWTGLSFTLARRGGLGKEAAVVLAVTAAMWPTVVRLINNQTVDIWLAVWWAAAWLQILKIKGQGSMVWLGIYLGMAAGTKYSGLLFAGVLFLVYMKDLRRLGWRKNMEWIIPAVVVGGFWYLRNYLLTGNPVYPATLAFWQGDLNFKLMDWKPWMTAIKYPGLLFGALISEYLVWPVLLLLPMLVRNRWVALGLLNLGVYLWLPSWPQNIVSDLRYTLVGFLPLLIAGWRWMKDGGREEVMGLVAVLCIAAEFASLDYRPKLWVLMIPVAAWLIKSK